MPMTMPFPENTPEDRDDRPEKIPPFPHLHAPVIRYVHRIRQRRKIKQNQKRKIHAVILPNAEFIIPDGARRTDAPAESSKHFHDAPQGAAE